jgi:ACS family tartrate transporter-like MFS transporter
MELPRSSVDPASVRRKVAWRILPLMLFLYILSYLDRANVGYAKLKMQTDLGFSDSVFGWGFGIFFVGYLLLEVPGALLVEHWSARKWFARILFTWGIASMAMAFVQTPTQFYVMRFLLGLAEAGFFPGVIVYFTHWFPHSLRARAMAYFVLGVPISQAFGAVFSGWLMSHDWLGYAGWPWVFLLEGAPAVLLGLVLPWLLTDRPHQASWLSPQESQWLEHTLEAERREAAITGGLHLRDAIRHPIVWLLAFAIFFTNIGGYGFGFWLPTVMNEQLKAEGEVTESIVLYWTGIIYLFGLAGVWISGQSSDRTGERKWHCIAGQVGTTVFLILSTFGQAWEQVFACLCCVGFFAVFWPSPFWVLPTLTLSASAAAVSIGFINMAANLSGVIGPPLVGELKSANFTNSDCLRILACGYLTGALFIMMLRVRKPIASPQVTSAYSDAIMRPTAGIAVRRTDNIHPS